MIQPPAHQAANMAGVLLLTIARATVDGQAVIALNVSVISHVLLLLLEWLIAT